MAGEGAPKLEVSGLDASGRKRRIAVIAAQWHTQIMDGLIAGALRVADEAGAEVKLARVPGSVELAVAAEKAAQVGFDAVVALGVVIRGDTPHFDYVCQAATHGLNEVALRHTVPVGFGVLTVDTEAQALDRAGLEGSREDKGAEAMEAVLVTADVLEELGGALER
ncbi:MAG TPA: 6,7-dimethyl-8-ribityllumazine synthase [Actinomycetales bacterium]|nr:6,7-dimethyl-8-ribityllumazine synthase [Actinomycetales bacterium]